MRYIDLKETTSTNNWMKEHCHEIDNDRLVVTADFQTSGRGCDANKWVSEAGKNLLFTLFIRSVNLPANQQFMLSMATAVAVQKALSLYTDGIMLKWPNDIYWRDNKLGGMLIEVSVNKAVLKNCLLGIGLNINQDVFPASLPNPVSLKQIMGREVDRKELLQEIIKEIEEQVCMIEKGDFEKLISYYHACLYRKGEYHKYRFKDGEIMTCKLEKVCDDGYLLLSWVDEQGEDVQRRFAFKEVEFII